MTVESEIIDGIASKFSIHCKQDYLLFISLSHVPLFAVRNTYLVFVHVMAFLKL